VLASACPGWVCYAEKTQGANLLPHISAVKSPQAVMGSIVKRRLAALRGWDPARVYHATVMPCYDKKLEASREDFLLPGAPGWWVGGRAGW
jgi:iron only hydrogenase large subunit-like protein